MPTQKANVFYISTINDVSVSDNIGSPACSPDPGGKKTPEGVIKRHGGLGHGGNADLMAEMREKRASMAMHPKAQGNLIIIHVVSNLNPRDFKYRVRHPSVCQSKQPSGRTKEKNDSLSRPLRKRGIKKEFSPQVATLYR